MAAKKITILVILFLLAGCSANGLVIRYFYGEFDDKLYDRITAFATFTEEQKQQIKQAVSEYKTWHQENELPRYSVFLNRLSTKLESGEITEQTVLDYFGQARNFAKTGFQHSPVYKHPEFFKALTDRQVEEIQNHFAEQDKEFDEWYQQRQEESGEDARLKRIVKNTKRIADINLNETQQQIIQNGLEKIKSEPLERHEIYNRWQAEFVEILKQRSNPGFMDTVTKHLDTYQDQIKLDNPKQYENNQKIAANTLSLVLNSLDKAQKQALLKRLNETQQTIVKMASS